MTKGDAIDLSAGTSNVLWEVRLLWNSRKHETHSFYWSDDVDAVTREALGVWDSLGDNPEYRDTMDNVDGTKTRPGAPYQGFSCLNAGSSCLHISVAALKQHRIEGLTDPWCGNDLSSSNTNYPGDVCTAQIQKNALKRLLKSRKIAYTGGDGADVLALRLHEYIQPWVPGFVRTDGEGRPVAIDVDKMNAADPHAMRDVQMAGSAQELKLAPEPSPDGWKGGTRFKVELAHEEAAEKKAEKQDENAPPAAKKLKTEE